MATLSTAARNAALAAIGALANGGSVRIYAAPMPATPAESGGPMLAECLLGDPAFAAPVNGTMAAPLIQADTGADATGTAAWFRVHASTLSAVLDGTCGTAGADMVMPSTDIQAGAPVTIETLVIAHP